MGRLKKGPAKTPQQRQSKDEEEYEQKHEHLIDHNDPHCLKSGEERALVFLEGRIRRGKRDCQAHGRDVRFIHHRESLYRSEKTDQMRTQEITHPQNNQQNSTSLISKFTVT